MSTNPQDALSGTPPKTSAAIRVVLKHVHAANAHAASDLPSGSARRRSKGFVPAAEFRRAHEAKEFAAILDRWEIPSKIVRRGRHRFVHVAAVHLDEALKLAGNFRRAAQQRRQAEQLVLPPRRLSFKATLQLWLVLLAILVGVGVGHACLGDLSRSRSPGIEVVVGLLGGGAIGYFTAMACAPMIERVEYWLARRRRRATRNGQSADDAPIDASLTTRSSWSTLLTISRNRKHTR
jgi:hypothetical protein